MHTVYAVYHLMRSSKGRTPASSASYMLFSAIMDAGLIPFFVFTALISRSQYTQSSDSPDGWTTLFGADRPDDRYKIIYSLFLITITNGGLHLVSLCISVYLALVFRKISRLPPDMNPLEDNLTSRHKRNKSSLSMSATEANSNRNSHLSDPLIGPPRKIPFLHTRTDSSSSVPSQRNLNTSNRESQIDLSEAHSPDRSPERSQVDLTQTIYEQPFSERSSMADFVKYTSRSPSRASLHAKSRRNSRPGSARPPSVSPVDENWITYPSPSPSPELHVAPPEFQHLRNSNASPKPNKFDFTGATMRPLEMNPPTPPINWDGRRPVEQRALTSRSGNSSITSEKNYSSRSGGMGVVSSKARFYGDMHRGMVRDGRVVSSGADNGLRDGARMRGVSGKIAEEGRAF